MPRKATSLPKDEQAIYDRIDANKAKAKAITDKGDKATKAEQDTLTNLKNVIANDSAALKKMQTKRILGLRIANFQTAATRLRMAAGSHSDAQRDFVTAKVDEAAESIKSAFSVKEAPSKVAAVNVPD